MYRIVIYMGKGRSFISPIIPLWVKYCILQVIFAQKSIPPFKNTLLMQHSDDFYPHRKLMESRNSVILLVLLLTPELPRVPSRERFRCVDRPRDT
jgi:hypothetical protein